MSSSPSSSLVLINIIILYCASWAFLFSHNVNT
uniref:Uncharacterized protein n=1 Tax=Anguilla anguilla TaxID=7936 RepID=A0A0E9SZE4_ANGAN